MPRLRRILKRHPVVPRPDEDGPGALCPRMAGRRDRDKPWMSDA
jgi:hypothetical protein